MSINPVLSPNFAVPPIDPQADGKNDLGALFHSLINPTIEQATYGIDGAQRSQAVPVPEQDKKSQDKKGADNKPAIRDDFVATNVDINGNPESESVKPIASAEDFSIGDLIDVMNPLQHIPIVSTLYRDITGDNVSPAANVMGGLIFGGPLGLLVASANAIFAQENNGKDMGQSILAAITGDDAATPAIAATAPTPQNVAADDAALPAAETASDYIVADGKEGDGAINLANLPDATTEQTPIESPPTLAAPAPAANSAAAEPAAKLPIAPAAMPDPAPIAPQQMPEFMMRALDKYEAMIKSRNQGQAPLTIPESTVIAP